MSGSTSGEVQTVTSVEEIEASLRLLGTPERAASSRRYLKIEIEHLGTRVPEVRSVIRPGARALTSHAKMLTLTEALWERPVFELRLGACLLLDYRPDLVRVGDLATIRRFVGEAETWALVDVLSTDVLGELLLAHPEAAAKLDSWVADPDFWVRRAALLSQIEPLKAGADFDRFGAWADALLDEGEFFIRKAIGWVLREAGKTRSEEVHRWLLPRAARASGVTMREAVKYLAPEQRAELETARRG